MPCAASGTCWNSTEFTSESITVSDLKTPDEPAILSDPVKHGELASHQTGPFGGRIGWGRRPCLLIIDMVEAYFRDGSPLYLDRYDVVDATARLLRTAREGAIPVVYTVLHYDETMRDAGHFVKKAPALNVFRGVDPPLGEIVQALRPDPGELVIPKQYASAFFGTSLSASLASLGADTVVIAGVSTSGCVRASATDALQYGYRPMVVAAATADRTKEFHDNNLRDLDAKYADVIDLDEACAQLARASGWLEHQTDQGER